jgi:hypothetical protein
MRRYAYFSSELIQACNGIINMKKRILGESIIGNCDICYYYEGDCDKQLKKIYIVQRYQDFSRIRSRVRSRDFSQK